MHLNTALCLFSVSCGNASLIAQVFEKSDAWFRMPRTMTHSPDAVRCWTSGCSPSVASSGSVCGSSAIRWHRSFLASFLDRCSRAICDVRSCVPGATGAPSRPDRSASHSSLPPSSCSSVPRSCTRSGAPGRADGAVHGIVGGASTCRVARAESISSSPNVKSCMPEYVPAITAPAIRCR